MDTVQIRGRETGPTDRHRSDGGPVVLLGSIRSVDQAHARAAGRIVELRRVPDIVGEPRGERHARATGTDVPDLAVGSRDELAHALGVEFGQRLDDAAQGIRISRRSAADRAGSETGKPVVQKHRIGRFHLVQ